jgi:hypothetical protein
LFQETCCRFHNAVLELLVLFFSVLDFEVFNIGSAKSTTQFVNMKVNIFVPFIVNGTKKISPDSASFGATESLKLPDVRQEIFEICG